MKNILQCESCGFNDLLVRCAYCKKNYLFKLQPTMRFMHG